MFTRFVLVAAAIAGSSYAMPAPQAAEPTTTIFVTRTTTQPWPHVCQTTVATRTDTTAIPVTTTTATEPFSTSTIFFLCAGQGCGATEFPTLSPVATAAPRELEGRALKTVTREHVYMEPTCVEYRDATQVIRETITDPSLTATATTYLSTTTVSAIKEYCNGWEGCPGSPYIVTAV
ncbi:hypothetical protein BDV98DRAFT_627026 [Pterulicium gracile]|uniref:Uncharacterized protein n=1 Tax=Pterulicium gracile TaxID=1884261 RepID=A0A5C3QAZ4_9AGAR|nr:hypothetical protein BDV98DRAFT_627026 [Pterula gracilis]